MILAAFLCGCATVQPLPKANLSEPGWNTRQGQAVWLPRPEGPEIAGDLLVATRADGSAFVQFTKTPIPMAIAQTAPAGWRIEFPPQNKSYAGRGRPPGRIVWFQLANGVADKPIAKDWTWQKLGDNWQLTNSSSGESLEGFLSR